MARTARFGTGGLAGGMRGSKASELIVVQPRPSLFTVTVLNLARLLGTVTGWAARHPSVVAALSTAVVVSAVLGLIGLGVLLGATAAGLWLWRRWHRASYLHLVVSRWRGFWVYRRRWQPAMHTCRLSEEINGREYLPTLRRITATEHTDRVSVELLSGQSPAQFEAATSQLAHTFEALRCRVLVDRPGRITVEFTHGDPLTATVTPVSAEQVPDLERLAIGRREDGSPWVHRLLGTHLLVAGATGAGKGSVLWSLIRAMGPAIRDGAVQVWAIDPRAEWSSLPGLACSPGSPTPTPPRWSSCSRTRS
jgi:S-DNA-T family DNA segregation ATPase FtsK/SpoIIIE